MYDYGLSTLTQYGITAQSASRTRGALVCRTDQGLLILKQFHGSEKKLQFQQELLQKLAKEGCQVDTFLENQTGSLITKDKDNIPYTIQNWFEGAQRRIVTEAKFLYSSALEKGIAKECARVLLPEGLTVSRMYMNGTLRSWIHYCQGRVHESTQKEHRIIAEAILDILRKLAPLTISAVFD